jgi:transcriptional regulator with XRE-family HTH domain
MANILIGALNAADFGEQFRAERRALKRTQAWVAEHAGVRRETITQLERGENVGLHVIMRALGALGKGLLIVSDRPDYDQVKAMLQNE